MTRALDKLVAEEAMDPQNVEKCPTPPQPSGPRRFYECMTCHTKQSRIICANCGARGPEIPSILAQS